MNDVSRKELPPMAMLHSFASAVRFGSFSKAGEEVGLTQSAVSRQIANLEDLLGSTLFDRVGRRVVLNERGRAYAEEIMPALGRIRRATNRAMTALPERVIELATLPSFGMRWLAPRLSNLSARHPDLVVNIAARSDEFDFATEPYDAAIHVGRANWPKAEHHLLFSERVVPVVAPRTLQDRQIAAPSDLLKIPLLVQSARRDAWERWFARYSPGTGAPAPSSQIAHFLMLAQAAAAGAGAALIPTFLIEPELRSGALLVPFDLALDDDRSYYLVYPLERSNWRPLIEFREWMLEQAAEAE